MKDKGTIIILNGPSSCGKTTLSKNLQKIWKTPLYHLSYDIVDGYMTPRTFPFADENEAEHDFLTVMYVSAAAIAKTGRDVVIDNCLFRYTGHLRDITRDNARLRHGFRKDKDIGRKSRPPRKGKRETALSAKLSGRTSTSRRRTTARMRCYRIHRRAE